MKNLDEIAHEAMRQKARDIAKTAKDTRVRLSAPEPPQGVEKAKAGDTVMVPVFKKNLRGPEFRNFRIDSIGPNGEWIGEWL